MFKKVEVGDVVAEKYTIIRHLDDGGMGSIFEAEEKIAEATRTVALKVMHVPGDEEGQIRFKREVSAVASVKHPHIVTIHAFGTTDSNSPYLVMELLKGNSFKTEITQGPIEALRLLQIMRQICGALDKAHAKRIIHRDIKIFH